MKILDQLQETAEELERDVYEIVDKTKERKYYHKLTEQYGQEYVDTIIGKICFDLMYDAEAVRAQVGDFREALESNKKISKQEGFEFFREIWCGDTYGVSGMDGLKELLSSLEESRKELDLDRFYSLIRAQIVQTQQQLK